MTSSRAIPRCGCATLEARWLFIVGLCHAAEYLTDGLLRKSDVTPLTTGLRQPNLAIQQLVRAGLWDKVRDGYRIHDFLDYNPSADEVKSKRAVRAYAGRLGGQRSGASRRGKNEANASQVLEAKSNPVPVPSRPERDKELSAREEPERLVPMPAHLRNKMGGLFSVETGSRDPSAA